MTDLCRRDAMKLVAGLTLSASGAIATEAAAEDAQKLNSSHPPIDRLLDSALKNPQSFMFFQQVTSKLAAGDGYELVITSARGIQGAPETLRVRSGTMAIFRADSRVDEFTKQGGWRWECGKEHGSVQFEKRSPYEDVNGELGALVMVVRQMDGTIHWHSLIPDLRC